MHVIEYGVFMKRIREVLRNEYIGAIAIGVLLASAITGLIGALVQPVFFYLESKPRPSSVFATEPAQHFPWLTMISGLVPVALYFLVAYLLLRWLYLRPDVRAERESGEDQSDSSAKDSAKS